MRNSLKKSKIPLKNAKLKGEKIMKKAISLLLISAIVISAIFCVTLTASAASPKAADQWIMDFGAGQKVIDRDVFFDTSLKTSGVYSKEQNAAIFSSTVNNMAADSRTPGFIVGGTVTSNSNKPLSVTNSSVTKYPILAMRIKLSDASMIVERIDWTTDLYEAEGSIKWRPITGAAVSATTEWQTLYLDMSNDSDGTTQATYKKGGYWSGFRFFFKSKAGNANYTSVTFAWAGVFETVEAAGAYQEARENWLGSSWEIDFEKDGVTAVNKTKAENSSTKTFSSNDGAAVYTSNLTNLGTATRSPSVLFGRFSNVSTTDVSDKNVCVTKYKIIAVKLKLSDEDITFNEVDWSADTTNTRYIKNPNNSLDKTTDWQLCLFDVSQSGNLAEYLPENTYTGFRLCFFSPAGKENPASVEIAYMKLFETVEDANAYELARESAKNTDKSYVVDFANESDAFNTLKVHNSLSTLKYDYSTSVARITATGEDLTQTTRAPAVEFGSVSNGNIAYELAKDLPVKDYPIIAIKLKLSNPNLKFDRLDWIDTIGITGPNPSDLMWRNMSGIVDLQETTDWQTLIIDTRTLTNGNDLKWLGGNWAGVRVLFKSESASTGDFVDIKWIGYYKDMQTLNAKTSEQDTIFGDANGDGVFNLLDLVKIKKYLANTQSETVNTKNADLNGVGGITADDLALLRTRLFNL